MTKHAAPLLIAAADPLPAQKGGGWIKLMPAGTFTLRDGRGPFTAGDRAAMEAIVARTKDYLGSTDLMVDYDHQVLATGENGGASARAAGWITNYEVRDDGIWGQVSWTNAASTAIEEREYRYLSPFFGVGKKGQVTRFINIALTNTPAMDLSAIAARAHLTLSEGPTMDPILEALGLAEGASEADTLSAINALKSGQSTIAAAAGVDKDADTDTIAAAIAKAVKAAAASEPDPAKFVPIEQVTALQSNLKELSDSISGDKAEAAVAAAIEQGKLAPALKDWGLKLAKSSLDEFEKFAASAPVLTNAQLGTKPAGKVQSTTSDPQEIAAAATAYQKKQREAGFEVDFASAVAAVKDLKEKGQ